MSGPFFCYNGNWMKKIAFCCIFGQKRLKKADKKGLD